MEERLCQADASKTSFIQFLKVVVGLLTAFVLLYMEL